MITLVAADAQEETIRDLAIYFDRVSDISLISYANDGVKAIEVVNKYKPNVIMMNLKIPVINGIEAINIMTHHFPNTKIILSIEQEDCLILNLAMNAGAKGVIFKNTSFQDLEKIIRLVTQDVYQIGSLLSESNQAKSTAKLAISLNNENNQLTKILNGINDLKQSIASDREIINTIVRQHKSKSNKYSDRYKITPHKYEYRRKYLIDLSHLGNDSFFITGFILGILCCAIAFYFLSSFL